MRVLYVSIVLCIAFLWACPYAHADYTLSVLSSTTVKAVKPADQSTLDELPKSKPSIITYYMSGAKLRWDSDSPEGIWPNTFIMDRKSNTAVCLNKHDRTYERGSIAFLLMGAGARFDLKWSKCKVIDTGKTTQILGHVCRHYIVLDQSAIDAPIRADVLAAQDLSTAGSVNWAAMYIGGYACSKINGLPLVVTLTGATGHLEATITSNITMDVTSVTSTPIPESIFNMSMPAGYKELK